MRKNISPMALPSRLSLWMGVGLAYYGYSTKQIGITWIGVFLIGVGGVLWLMYRPPFKLPLWLTNRRFIQRLGILRFIPSSWLHTQTKDAYKKDTQEKKLRQSIKEGAMALERIKKSNDKAQ